MVFSLPGVGGGGDVGGGGNSWDRGEGDGDWDDASDKQMDRMKRLVANKQRNEIKDSELSDVEEEDPELFDKKTGKKLTFHFPDAPPVAASRGKGRGKRRGSGRAGARKSEKTEEGGEKEKESKGSARSLKMPLFYHYTDDEGAAKIIRSGRIMASLGFMSGGDTAYGNGVYLTELNPKTYTKTEIARNNWMNTSPQAIMKMENYFVLDIPESDVEETEAKDRNIFLFGYKSDLRLSKYPWWLKRYESGEIIASYKYRLMSLGPASKVHGDKMGDYVMTEDTVNGRPVYKHPKASLFMDTEGNWLVAEVAGDDLGWLYQESEFSLGPDPNLPWTYWNFWNKEEDDEADEDLWEDDDTLKAYAWQI